MVNQNIVAAGGRMMKTTSYISVIIALALLFSLGGCNSSDNNGPGLSDNNREFIPFDEDIEVWFAEESISGYDNSPQLYLKLRTGEMYTSGYGFYAIYSKEGFRIVVDVYGLMEPQEGLVYPDVMVWPEIRFPVGELDGHYDLVLNYGDLTDVYRVEVSGVTISMVPVETNFSRMP